MFNIVQTALLMIDWGPLNSDCCSEEGTSYLAALVGWSSTLLHLAMDK